MRARLATAVLFLSSLTGTLAAQDVYLPGDQVTAPTIIRAAKPLYTPEAMIHRLRGSAGSVVLQVDVLPDGTVGTVALVRSALSEALVENAVRAVKQSLYTPGMKDGKPVTVRIEVTVPFSAR
jgi:periplasmic protein TonB